MIVLKFGGSSVQNAVMIRKVLAIAKEALPDAPVLVSSAMAKTTDRLLEVARLAAAGETHAASEVLTSIADLHKETLAELCPKDGARVEHAVEELLGELEGLVYGVSLIRECSPRTRDALLSFGERLSTTIIAAAAVEAGIESTWMDARSLIVTDDTFGEASPLQGPTQEAIGERLHPAPGRLVITQGFIASTVDGVTTTLGRGGSDFSATILGAALGAERVEIWTDVSGIMTADPRIVPHAQSLATLSYDEAAELAYFGAKVVHPATISPAMEHNIPVIVRNTTEPRGAGTRIQVEDTGHGVRAIASKKHLTLITVESSRMLNAFGFLHALFEIFDRHRTSVDLVATSEVSVSMTVDREAPVDPLVADLQRLGIVSVERDKSIICVVGRGMLQSGEFLAGVFSSLAPIPIRMISLGSSDINLSLVVAQEKADSALQALHEQLFPTDAEAC